MIHPYYLNAYLAVYKQKFDITFPEFDSYIIKQWVPINLDFDFELYHYSTPTIKLYYPEPFIASPQFSHEDYWFLHIVIYQYWLWFFFIYCIIFYFLVFLVTVRWGNLRYRPGRETRGVSRSKCGDLITATVPVTWAASIIIHESVDAVEFADGFGTTELSIGIRAYQWGWEYYYPRDLAFNQMKRAAPLSLGYSDYFETPKKGSVSFDRGASSVLSDDSGAINSNAIHLLTPSSLSNKLFNSMVLNKLTVSNNKLFDNQAVKSIRSSRLVTWRNQLFFSPRTNLFSSLNKFFYLYKNYWESSLLNEPHFENSQTYILQKTAMINSSFNYSNRWFLEQYLNPTLSFICNAVTSASLISFKDYLINSLIKHYSTSNTRIFYLTRTMNFYLYNSINSLGYPKVVASIFENSSIAKKLFLETWLILQSTLASNLIHHSYVDYKRHAVQELTEDYLFNLDLLTPLTYKFGNVSFINQEIFSQLMQIHLKTQHFWTLNTLYSFVSRTLMHNDRIRTNLEDFSLFRDLNILYSLSILRQWTELYMIQLDKWNNNRFINATYQQSLFYANWVNSKFKLHFISNDLLFHSNTPFLTWLKSYNDYTYKFSYLNLQTILLTWSNRTYEYTKPYFWFHDFISFRQAFLKVFKPIFEDSRSSLVLQHFDSVLIKSPLNFFKEVPKVSNILKLGDNEIFTTPFHILKRDFELFNSFRDISNYLYLALPFSFSKDSDVIRGIWLDWYSPRSLVTTRAVDLAQFGLYGAKLHSYNFTNTQLLGRLNQFETFFNKYLYSRKFYLPFIIHFPFYYLNILKERRSFVDTILTDVTDMIYRDKTTLTLVKTFLLISLDADSNFFFIDFEFLRRFNIYWSSYRSFIHFGDLNLMTPFNKITFTTRLFDTLTRRDIALNTFFLYTPHTWHFWDELLLRRKKILRDFFYIDSWASPHILNISNPEPKFSDVDFHHLSSTLNLSDNFWKDVKLSQTSQYQPFKKGVANMIRIQADKAVAMPIDIRLQILATSKDIIHSWAIPSAGVKIDCIPGYSSHRVICFSVSGIYWGQCMEICGRFHHWMPIVVYFVKREIFLMWCIHFVFNSDNFSRHFSSMHKSPEALVSYPWSYWLEDDFSL